MTTNKEKLQNFSEDKTFIELQNYILEKQKKDRLVFNIFKVLRLDNHEIRHSNFLAWLLDPKESHLLGNQFLTQFLDVLSIKESTNIINMNDIEVKKEYTTDENRRIDLLIHSKNSDFICVIENKYGSDEHDEQCKHYKKFIENKFSKYKHKYFIFLDIEEPSQKMLNGDLKGYIPVTYKQIYNILSNLMDAECPNMIVKEIIAQYIEIIKEKYPMLDENIKEKCREIYKNHKEAVAAIEKYKNYFQNDMYNVMKEVINDGELEFKQALQDEGYNNTTGCGVRFLPVAVDAKKVFSDEESKILPLIFISLEYKEYLTLAIRSRNCLNDSEKEIIQNLCKAEYQKLSGDGKNWITYKEIKIDDLLGKTCEEIKSIIKSHIKNNKIKEEYLSMLELL